MKVEHYRAILSHLEAWEPFLLEESRLPGPRANLELLQAVADEGNEKLFRRLLYLGSNQEHVNSPLEFLGVCGIVGLGRLLAEGNFEPLETVRSLASDPRWRIREGVAMALQRLGEANMETLLEVAEQWSRGNLLERRAAIAALCEPRLLRNEIEVRRVLQVLDFVTASLAEYEDRHSPDFKTLRQALGYGWSVAVVALPEEGKPLMEKWLASGDSDVAWVMRENLGKKRLVKMDKEWVAGWRS